jgi:hypothetical protein
MPAVATIATDAPLAVAVTQAIRTGDVDGLRRLLREHGELAGARLTDADGVASRTLLHVATDWPGHFPNGPAVVAALVEAGADVNARFVGPHTETPLHWAASSDDDEVLDALIDAGADLEAKGAVLGGGTRWPTRSGSGSGGPPGGCWSEAPAPRSGRRPPSAFWTGSRSTSPPPTRPPPMRSPRPSGRPATAGSAGPPSTCSNVAPTATGSAGTIGRRSTSPRPRVPTRLSNGCAPRVRGRPPSADRSC